MSNFSKPLVSVIIPTFNRAGTLARAMKSVLSQDYKNFELIIVDDGSTDNTSDILKNFSDERIKIIVHDKNRGVGAARNTGIDAAAGEIVAFQDSDDEWLDGKLTKQIAELANSGNDCVLVYCTKIVYGRDINYLRGLRRAVCVPGPEVTELAGDLRKFLWEHHVISTQTMVVRTEALRQIGGFDTRLYNSEEWDLAIRLSELGKFAFIDEPLVNNYIQADSISTLSRKAPYSQLIIINKMKRRHIPRRMLGNHWARLGFTLGKLGYPKRGDVLIRASLSAQPLNLKTWGRFIVNRLHKIRGTK